MSEATPVTERGCTKCGEVKTLTEFSPAKNGLYGRRADCKACMRAWTNAWRVKKRGGPPKPPRQASETGLLRCTKCGETKSTACFRPDPRNRDGLRSHCKDCDRARARERQRETEQSARWARENPEQYARIVRRSTLRRKYGMELEDYETLFEAQGGRCAICGSTETKSNTKRYFAIDHDHETGAVRGLLCIPCNTGIGGLQDDPRLVAAALRYILRAHMERQGGLTVDVGVAMEYVESAIGLLDIPRPPLPKQRRVA